MKAGDITGWSSLEPQSMFINVVTGGIPLVGVNHLGIIAEYDGRLEHFEVTTRDNLPCLIKRRIVSGAQCNRLADRLKTYPGRAWLYPLYRELYPHESDRLTSFLVKRIGEPYDTLGAIESGGWFGLLAGLTSWLRPRSRRKSHSWFCSKEDAAVITHAGLMQTDDPGKWNPNRLVRHLRRKQILLPRVRLK